MLQNKKMVIPGLVLTLALGGFTLVHAATNATAATAPKPTAATAATTASSTKPAPKQVKPAAQPQAKLSQDQATKIALAAHKGAKLVEIKLVIENGKPFYLAKLGTSKGSRELKIGGNSGKIFKDTLTAAVKAK